LSDISGHWAETYIKAAYGQGWISGYPDESFKPNQPITRAEAVTLVNRMLGWSAFSAVGKPNPFTDIAAGEWYHDDVIIAANGK
jgi:hypothetical protein